MSRSQGSAGRAGGRWRRIRLEVLQRDGRICWMCKQPGADSVDHLIPLSRGGDPYAKGNLAAAHMSCNLRRGTGEPRKRTGAPLRTSRAW
jgi:5-methylcytosine-specific restriction endonuclease McrA